jgi:hypothetical protein
MSRVLLRFPQPEPRRSSPVQTGARHIDLCDVVAATTCSARGRTAPVPLGAVPIRCQRAMFGLLQGTSGLLVRRSNELPARAIRAGSTGQSLLWAGYALGVFAVKLGDYGENSRVCGRQTASIGACGVSELGFGAWAAGLSHAGVMGGQTGWSCSGR